MLLFSQLAIADVVNGEVDDSPIITFADEEVKALCVANWDKNGDNELSENEAKAVTEFSTVFWNNSKIKTFDELKYFTGLVPGKRISLYNCSELTSATLPENATVVYDSLFLYCSKLASIDIPETVTKIGNGAFCGCSSLTSVTIPETVTYIGLGAFDCCYNLAEIVMNENNIEYIGEEAFSGTKWYNNKPDGLIYIGNIAYHCKGKAKDGMSVEIKDGTTMLSPYIFNEAGYIASVTIPNSVTKIGKGAFYGCSQLTSMTIPESVKEIEGYLFYGCSNLTSVTLHDDITSLGEVAFYGCKKLESITIPQNVTSIEIGCFENCVSLSSITIPANVKKIIPGAFRFCYIVKDQFVNNSTLDAEANDYWGLTFVDSREEGFIKKDGVLILYNGKAEDVVIPSDITSINRRAFELNSTIKTLVMPNSVTKTSDEVFSGCFSLETVTLSNNLETIESYTFRSCSKLKTITIPASVTRINDSAFAYCSSLTSVTIPEGVTYIGSNAFNGCTGLTEITIPNSVTALGYGIFESDKNLTSAVISKNVTSIPYRLFCNCSSLKEIVIPDGVTEIESCAFQGCTGLTEITFPANITLIDSWAMEGCTSLKHVTSLATTPPTMKSYTFKDNYSATLHVPSGYIDTYKRAEYWKNFSKIVDTPVDDSPIITFADATVKALCVANWDQNGDNELSENEAKAVTFWGTVFMNNSNIRSFDELKYFTGLTIIDDNAFLGCKNLTSITIPQNLPYIGYSIFSGCDNLTSLKVADGNQYFDSRDNCNAIINKATNTLVQGCKTTIIPASIVKIGMRAFQDCTCLTEITIPDNITEIDIRAFYNCTGLESIVIPEKVSAINSGAFAECQNLKNVYMKATTPPVITGSSFTYYEGSTLHVPAGCKESYQNAYYTEYFTTIEEEGAKISLDIYDYNGSMYSITDRENWGMIQASCPNAVAVVAKEQAAWAEGQTNVVVMDGNAYSCPNLVLADLSTYDGDYEETGFYFPYDFTATKGEYSRQAYAGYNTICLPFSIKASELSSTAKVFAFESVNQAESTVRFQRVKGDIPAGAPCIVKEGQDVVWNINLANKKISAITPPRRTTMAGTFVTTEAYQNIGYSPSSNNEFSPLSQYLHPFRACFIMNNTMQARGMKIVLDDEITGITEIENGQSDDALKDGKYFENGRMIIYKNGMKYNVNGTQIK